MLMGASLALAGLNGCSTQPAPREKIMPYVRQPQSMVAGKPRRYHVYPPEFQVLNVRSSAGASILAVGYVLPLFYLVWSLYGGKPAGPNLWGAIGQEWQTPSPPPPRNFDETPIVTIAPHEYSLGEADGVS